VLDLSAGGAAADINEMIGRLEQEHDLVIVQLPGLVSDEAAAAFREGRPVLLVTPERRVERSRLEGAVQLLRRLDVPCAVIVMSGPGGTERLRATRSATAVATTSA
jgi:Mrp family chromosome partitioning ATPase